MTELRRHDAPEQDGTSNVPELTTIEASAEEVEVTAVEAHPKRSGMYRVWVRVPADLDAMLSVDNEQDGLTGMETRGTGQPYRRAATGKIRKPKSLNKVSQKDLLQDSQEVSRFDSQEVLQQNSLQDSQKDPLLDSMQDPLQDSHEYPHQDPHPQPRQDSQADWHTEVDAWLQDAVHAANRNEPNEYALTVHEDTLVSMRLLKGKRLSPAEWSQLRREEALEEAYRAALAIVERKARTSREVAEALKRKGYAPDAISGCLQRMQDRRLLDDAAYARRFAEQRTTGQRKGRHLVRQELMQRGISKEEADRAIGELDDRLEIEAANALARKKWPQLKGEPRERRMKLKAFLMRRGFPGDIVRAAVQHVLAEAETDDDDGFA